MQVFLGSPAENHPDEAWDKVMNLNLNSVFRLSKEVAVSSMIPNQYGKIINIASIAGLVELTLILCQQSHIIHQKVVL